MASTSRRTVPVQWIRSLPIPLMVLVAVCSALSVSAVGETKSDPVAVKAPAAKVSEEQATQAALQALPGKVTDVTVEKKRGKNVYVIEIVAAKDGVETDVLIDMETGAVLGMEH
jgi:uncharacterized membrane protein YkoI